MINEIDTSEVLKLQDLCRELINGLVIKTAPPVMASIDEIRGREEDFSELKFGNCQIFFHSTFSVENSDSQIFGKQSSQIFGKHRTKNMVLLIRDMINPLNSEFITVVRKYDTANASFKSYLLMEQISESLVNINDQCVTDLKQTLDSILKDPEENVIKQLNGISVQLKDSINKFLDNPNKEELSILMKGMVFPYNEIIELNEPEFFSRLTPYFDIFHIHQKN